MVHGFGQSNRDNTPFSNWRDDLSWPSKWVSYGDCTSICDAHWTGPMVNHDVRLSIVMIHQAIILHGLSTLKWYWVCIKIHRRLWPMGETLKWSYIPMDLVTIDESWWQQVLLIEAPWYLIQLGQYVPLDDPKDMWSWNLWSH